MKQHVVKRILVTMWNKAIDIRNDCRDQLYQIRDKGVRRVLTPPIVRSMDETLQTIIEQKSSVARYGDGEFKLMYHQSITFQQADETLTQRLRDILQIQDKNFLVCLPDVFQDVSQYEQEPREYWQLHLAKQRLKWYKLLAKEKVYYNSFISRFYYPFQDKTQAKRWLDLLRLIWKDREIVLVEGRKSRLGVGNDLFQDAKSIERILIPEEHAFTKYEEILEVVKTYSTSKLILLAAGPTATVLAYDLYQAGYQTIDMGHVDIEYEWFLRQVKTKVQIENKYVCEAGAGQGVTDSTDEAYLREIKAVI